MQFISLFLAANGVGKSCIGAMIIKNICWPGEEFDAKNSRWQDDWGEPPKTFFRGPLFEKYPYPNRKIRIIADPTTIKEKIVPELEKWFPSNRYTVKYTNSKDGKGFISKWKTDTGFIIDLMTYEQKPKEFESADLDFIWFDEPPPKSIFMASVARLRQGGQIMMTLTPLTYSAWIKDDLYDHAEEKKLAYVECDVWANCKDVEGTRGILAKEAIENMIAQYPEDEKEARVKGKFGHLLGRVHKLFSERIHVVRPFTIKRNDFVVYMAHDTHPRVPDAVLWMAIDKKGTKYIIDELWMDGTDAELAAKIKQKEDLWRIDRHLLDPSGFNDDTRSTEQPFANRMQRLGIDYIRGSKDMMGGIRATDNQLAYEEKQGGEMITPPVVYVFANCVRTIKEFNTYIWDEYSGKTKDEKTAKARPKDKDDHFMEDVHRLLIEDFRWYPNISEQELDEAEATDPYSLINEV